MIFSVHQPNYIPYCGFFSKLKQADVHIFYNSAHYSKGDWHNRNKILTKNGEVMLTLPVLGLKSNMPINDVLFDYKVLKKHWTTIEQAYGKSKYFDAGAGFVLHDLYINKGPNFRRLADFNNFLITTIAEILGMDKRFLNSNFQFPEGMKGTDGLIYLLKKNAEFAKIELSGYISGVGGRDYLEPEKFEQAGIKLDFVKEPVSDPYKNYHLSILDLIFNEGPNAINYL